MRGYDPFAPGPFDVETRTVVLDDAARGRTFSCEIWQPSGLSGAAPLVVYSHYAGGHRRAATFLTGHLASRGYLVAAVDHSETFVPGLQPREGETAQQRSERIEAIAGSRDPDLRLVLDHLQAPSVPTGLVGHSLGGWSVLAAADADPRVAAVAALAPGGSRHPPPGVLRLQLRFARSPGVPTLFLAGENDVPVPLDDVLDVFHRAPEPKRLVVLRRADHQHFVDDVAGEHEALRSLDLPGPAAWMPAAMLPIGELTAPEPAHAFVRGLTAAHLDVHLRADERARAWLDTTMQDDLAGRGIEAWRLPSRQVCTTLAGLQGTD
jgi:dienelactone hydrolase